MSAIVNRETANGKREMARATNGFPINIGREAQRLYIP